MPKDDAEGPDRVRLDKWLWAARFFKTRSIAVEAIDGGKVEVNGDRAKRAKQLQLGDEVRVRQGPYEHVVHVRGLSERRGPAAEAATLYEETAQSLARRAETAERLKLGATLVPYEERGRPTTRDRREIERFRDRQG